MLWWGGVRFGCYLTLSLTTGRLTSFHSIITECGTKIPDNPSSFYTQHWKSSFKGIYVEYRHPPSLKYPLQLDEILFCSIIIVFPRSFYCIGLIRYRKSPSCAVIDKQAYVIHEGYITDTYLRYSPDNLIAIYIMAVTAPCYVAFFVALEIYRVNYCQEIHCWI